MEHLFDRPMIAKLTPGLYVARVLRATPERVAEILTANPIANPQVLFDGALIATTIRDKTGATTRVIDFTLELVQPVAYDGRRVNIRKFLRDYEASPTVAKPADAGASQFDVFLNMIQRQLGLENVSAGSMKPHLEQYFSQEFYTLYLSYNVQVNGMNRVTHTNWDVGPMAGEKPVAPPKSGVAPVATTEHAPATPTVTSVDSDALPY